MTPRQFYLLIVILLSTTTPTTTTTSSSDNASEGQGSRLARTDDITLADLRTLLERQAQTIDLLQSQLQAQETHVTSLESSIHSLTQGMGDLRSKNDGLNSQLRALNDSLKASNKAVGFSARFGHDGGQEVGVPLGQHSTLIFDSVIVNTGNGYDPHTGLFTAPVPGLYSLFLTQMTADSQDYLWLSLVVDGHNIDRIYTEGRNDTHDQGASQVVTHLNAGQKVWVRQEGGSAVRGGWFTVFTGYLVTAD